MRQNRLWHLLAGGAGGFCVCIPAVAFAALFSDVDPDWKEGAYELPAPPAAAEQRSFSVGSASPNRFFIDGGSLAVGADGVVRYVLTVRTPGGAENITFEGIHCHALAWKRYARWRQAGEWARLKDDGWQPIADNTYNRERAALAKDYFCDGNAPPRDRAEVLRRLGGEAGYLDPAGGRLP